MKGVFIIKLVSIFQIILILILHKMPFTKNYSFSLNTPSSIKKYFYSKQEDIGIEDFTFDALKVERKEENLIKFYDLMHKTVTFNFKAFDHENNLLDKVTVIKDDYYSEHAYVYLKFKNYDFYNHIGSINFIFSFILEDKETNFACFSLDFNAKTFPKDSSTLYINRSVTYYPSLGFYELYSDIWEINIERYHEIKNYSYFDFNNLNMELRFIHEVDNVYRNGDIYAIPPMIVKENKAYPFAYFFNNKLSYDYVSYTKNIIGIKNNVTYYVDQNENKPYLYSFDNAIPTNNYYFPYDEYKEFMESKFTLILSGFTLYNFTVGIDIDIKFLNGPAYYEFYNDEVKVIGEIKDDNNDNLEVIEINN